MSVWEITSSPILILLGFRYFRKRISASPFLFGVDFSKIKFRSTAKQNLTYQKLTIFCLHKRSRIFSKFAYEPKSMSQCFRKWIFVFLDFRPVKSYETLKESSEEIGSGHTFWSIHLKESNKLFHNFCLNNFRSIFWRKFPINPWTIIE